MKTQRFALSAVLFFLYFLTTILICSSANATSLYFDYEDHTFASGKVTSAGVSSDPWLSGISSQTGGGNDEHWGSLDAGSGRHMLITRWFGANNPYIQFTTTTAVELESLSFYHHHNHNYGYPSYPDYDVQMQIDSGSGFADIGGASFVASNSTRVWSGTPLALSLNNMVLDAGTYTIRWDPRNLAYGATNTGSEYFALDGVTLNVNPVPEPATISLLGIGLIGFRKFKKRVSG